MDLKQALINAVAKHAELKIQHNMSTRQRRGSSFHDDGGRDSESEGEAFEDVPEKEGYEPVIPEHLRVEYGERIHFCCG